MRSTLRLDTLPISAAEPGEDNPLPPLSPSDGVHAGVDADAADEEMARGLAYGHLPSLLPYTVQDGYGRERRSQRATTIVLENENLRATFLPGWGGRLWSLIHRPTGRELLYRNPVLQPANFALRGAWVAGGVEWNIGATGHSPLTCSPVHAARVDLDDGTPVLRLYEWERARGVAFQVDAWLPDGSPTLLVHVRIANPNDHETPMYWWSNIAVPESDDLRVLAPAESAYHFSYDKRLRIVPVPEHEGRDLTYPARSRQPADYFFECSQAHRPWIAALDGDGQGLVQASTSALRGRKLFLWGRSPGGRHWQEFLSGGSSGQEYCEIQAGLARTQLEHIPMPGRAQWSWVEAYGPLAADPASVHGAWSDARSAVERALDEIAPTHRLDAALAAARSWADRAPAETLHHGTGWGALERRRRAVVGATSLDLPGLPFPDESLGSAQRPWLDLLEIGALPQLEPDLAPASYVAGPAWLRLLETLPDRWAGWLHRGVARWHAGDIEGAREAWHRSLADRTNGWALRNLAAADRLAGRAEDAADRYRQAHALLPTVRPLTIETLNALLGAGQPRATLELIDELDASDRDAGRIHLLEARAALAAGDLDRAGQLLEAGIIVPDLREGEDALGALWSDYCAALRADGRPLADEALPYAYDFRMHV